VATVYGFVVDGTEVEQARKTLEIQGLVISIPY
jgi:hypothetical protein